MTSDTLKENIFKSVLVSANLYVVNPVHAVSLKMGNFGGELWQSVFLVTQATAKCLWQSSHSQTPLHSTHVPRLLSAVSICR